MNSANSDFDLPFPLSRDLFLRADGALEWRQYQLKGPGWAAFGVKDENLYKIAAEPGLGLFLTDNLLFTGRVVTGAYTDFASDLATKDFRVYGEGLLVYRLNPDAQVLVGAQRSEAFEDYKTYPLIGVRLLNEDGTLSISVTAPVEARLGFRPLSNVEFFGGAWAGGDKYRATLGDQSGDIAIRERRAGGGLSLWMGSHLNLVVEGGMLFDSQFGFETRPQRTDIPDNHLKPAPYVGAHLGMSL